VAAKNDEMTENKQCDKGNFVQELATRMSQILSELASTVFQEAGVKRLLVAFSGGPDSTALLTALAQLSEKMGWEINACHINHGLRGLESDLDEQFCEALCADLGIGFKSFRLAQSAESTASNHVPENLLRELRYRCLFDHARDIDIQVVLTGHTLDDQTETLLFRLFRGTSPTGLVGMAPHREMVPGTGVYLLRPLLKQTKAECQRFLAIEQIGAHLDSSNEDAHYARNFIRTQLVPGIDDKFPGWKNRVERLRLLVSEQEDWFHGETVRALSAMLMRDQASEFIQRSAFGSCHIALKRKLAAQMLRDKQIEPSFERVENVLSIIDGNGDSALTLSSGWEIRVDKDKVRWMPIVDDDEPSSFLMAQETIIRIPDQGSQSRSTIITWLNKSLKVSNWGESVNGNFPAAQSLEIYADLSSVSGHLKLRLRRPGDTIQPFGMTELVRLKKYLHTHDGAPPFQHTVVLTDDDSVLWVPGIGYSERLRCHAAPSHRLLFLDLAGPSDSSWA